MLRIYLSLPGEEDENSKFEQIYQQYRGLLYYIAMGKLNDYQLAEDAVQETFMRAAINTAKIESTDCCRTRNYLVVILKNVISTIQKDQLREKAILVDEGEVGESVCMVEAYEKYAELVQTILELPELYRAAIYLHGVCGYTYAEVSELLGITECNARKRMERGEKSAEADFGERWKLIYG